MVFKCISIRQVPWEVLKTDAFGLGFQHLQRDPANVNAWKTMFDPYIYYSLFTLNFNKSIVLAVHVFNPCPAEPGYTLPLQTL